MAPRSAGSNHRRRAGLIISTLLLFLVVRSLGSPVGNGRSGRSSVFSLFNIKERSWFWSESVMRGGDLKYLTSPGKMAYLNYTKAGNIANYLKLLEVDSIYLPVPVNFIFIGFDGKGSEEFKLHPEELERWFNKMDHIFEHTRVPPLGEVLSPFYKTTVDKEQRHHLPIISHVNYNFSVHAIQMSEKVSSVFERAINVLARKDDVSEPSFSVHAMQMGKKVSSVFERVINVLAGKDDVSKPSFSDHAIQLGKKISSVFERAINVLPQKDNVSEPSFSVHAMQMGKKVSSVFEHAINVLAQKDNVSEASFSNRAIQMGKKVSSVFERAINVLARKDDVSDPRETDRALWQVDVDMFDSLFTSLVEYLQLENAYNIFILNPKHDKKIAKYGYRRGLSKSEIDFLKENKSLQAKVLQTGGIPESILALDKIKRPLYNKHPMEKFAWTMTEDTDMAEWYNICQDALDNVEKLYQGTNIADIIESKVVQLLKGKNQDMKLLLDKELKSGDLSGLHSECLTDAWIGKDRWAFIDLSAGPFSWGPAVGGEGARTEYTLPNVRRTIGAVAEEEAEDRLQDAIQEKFAVFGDRDHQAIDILLAEINMYELFAFKHCNGRKVKLALCEELDQRMEDLKNELQEFEGEDKDESQQRKSIEVLKRMESWNLFSDTHEEFQNYTVARDTFLAHLGATLWGSMRHIISPSMADGAFHYYEKISFQLFFITQEKIRHIKKLPVDLTALMDGLSSLLLPSQKPMFSQNMLPLSEDPALAKAFSAARRAAVVPYLLINGTYRKSIRSYLDSSILQYHLQRLHDHGTLKGMHAHSKSTLEVPIFWFIHSDPLLVDQHYQAKALSDMVIVVQSESPSWESYLQCNGESLLWDLRRPVKAALSAAAEHLAGLLPLHLVYSQVHKTPVEDWVWSVGCNPFSVTSQGWHISRFHSDSIARSYIITALEESIQLVNSAIHLLVVEQTTAKTYKIFQSQERKLVNKYNMLVGLWKRISTSVGELRYTDALRFLNTLEDASKGFADQVNSTIALLHPVQCRRERKLHDVLDMSTVLAFLVVAVVAGVLFIVLRAKRPKPKIKKTN